MILFFDDQNIRKCPQKKDRSVHVYSNSHVLTTHFSEFRINTNKTGYAGLHDSWLYDLPCDTSMHKNGGYLYYAGGNDYNFTPILFEVYGVEIWTFKCKMSIYLRSIQVYFI